MYRERALNLSVNLNLKLHTLWYVVFKHSMIFPLITLKKNKTKQNTTLFSLKVIKVSMWLKLFKNICCFLLIQMTVQSKLLEKQTNKKHPQIVAECIFLCLILASFFLISDHNHGCGGQHLLTLSLCSQLFFVCYTPRLIYRSHLLSSEWY